MIAPRGLVGAALALWGASIGFPVAGAIFAIAFEATRFAPPSATFATPARLANTVRLCVLLAAGGLVYAGVTGRFPQALYAWLRWLPVLLLPLPVAQTLAGGSIPASVLVAALRPGTRRSPDARGIDTTFVFVAITLVAAATGGKSELWFYSAASAIAAWALIAHIPRRRWPACAALVLASVILGYGVHRGLFALQGALEELDPEILQGFFAPNPDPFRERTRIGDLRPIKMNDRILMRVFPEGPRPAVVLLRESAFDQYQGGEWKTSKRSFRAVERNADRWILREGAASEALTLRRSIPRGEGLLALPPGAHAIDHLPAETLEALPTGAVRAKGTPRFVSMRVSYDEKDESGTDAADLHVPELLAPVLDRVLAAERLVGPSPRATVAGIERFFADKFAYSLNASSPEAKSRTLTDFLLHDHKGHCEYFATGTTLLLRRAGIPARYTVGYSAQEYSALERALVVRNRHAHAWTSAFIDGRWITVDTTPSRWAEEEGEAARSPFGALLDLLSWAFDRALQWWIDLAPADFARGLALIVLLALLPLAIFFTVRRWRRHGPRATGASHRATRAWQAVESLLARQGHVRERGETVQEWTRRLETEPRSAPWRDELAALARAYYRVRFDPSTSSAGADDFVRAAAQFGKQK
jgi:protein-glutamine gamma-glutamyltransferase